jgi:hypothetical protein
MTQKEYREKLKQYENEIAELRLQLDKTEQTSTTGAEALQQYLIQCKENERLRQENREVVDKLINSEKMLEEYKELNDRLKEILHQKTF